MIVKISEKKIVTSMKIKFLMATSLIVTITTQAYAGFQFTAPVVQQPQVSIAPISGGLLPIIQDEKKLRMMPAIPSAPVVNAPIPPMVSQQPQSIISETPSSPVSTNTGMMSLSPQSSVTQNTHEIAVGFGSDLPLVTALRQIIPADYSYVLGKNVAVGETVSWSGGQEWPSVLDNTLSQLNLISTIKGNVVTISALQMSSVAIAKEPMEVLDVIETPRSQQAPISVLPSDQKIKSKAVSVHRGANTQPVVDMVAAMSAGQQAQSSMSQKNFNRRCDKQGCC